MAHFLGSQHLNNQEEVKASIKEFFTLKGKKLYKHRSNELVESCFQIVQHDGLYFEC